MLQDHSKDVSHLLIGNEVGLFTEMHIHTIENQAASITAWSQKYDQLSGGVFDGGLGEIWLENMQFFLEFTSKSLRQTCNAWPGAVWFGITQPSALTGFINEYPFIGGDVLAHEGGYDFELITPDNLNIIGIVVDKKVLRDYLRLYDPNYDFNLFIQTNHWRLNPQFKKYNWKRLIDALTMIKRVQKLSFERCYAMQENLVSQLIVTLLSDFSPSQKTQNTQKYYRSMVEKTREYILDQALDPPSITEICTYFKISRRTLQNAFQSTLSMSPNQYMKIIRLNAFRQSLIEQGEHSPIQDIAAQYGFWHTSQLAMDYKKLFGELPSQTVKAIQPIIYT